MEFDESLKESLSNPIQIARKNISIIDIDYEPCSIQKNRKFICYLHTTDYQKNSEKGQKTTLANTNLNLTSAKPIKTESRCLKKINKLKKNLFALQLSIQKKDIKSAEDSEKTKNLEKKTIESQKKIKIMKDTVRLHQEKLIRMEGLMHELEYNYLGQVNCRNKLRPSLNYNKKLKKIK